MLNAQMSAVLCVAILGQMHHNRTAKANANAAELQGKWIAVSLMMVTEGKLSSRKDLIRDVALLVVGNRYFHGKLNAEVQYQAYTLDIDDPKKIDLVNVQGNSRVVIRAIYELDGDRLRICCSPDPDLRPTSLEVTPSNRRMLWEFERSR